MILINLHFNVKFASRTKAFFQDVFSVEKEGSDDMDTIIDSKVI